jgi:AcrR family transcriptional regulator
MTAAPPGLRERKKEATRRALEDAALDLFARQGFDRTTVDEIAAACNVSTRTFFRYFATKEDVLVGDRPERLAAMVALVEARPVDEPPLRSIRAAVDDMLAGDADDRARLAARARIMTANPGLHANCPEAQLAKEEALVGALARRDATAGIPPRPLDLRLAVGVATATYRAAIDEWSEAGGTGDLADAVAAAFDRLAANIDRPA